MSTTTTAVIPVRAGSRRLKNKNIAPFAGTNLLLYKIDQLKRLNWLSDIVVTSDSDLMLDFAKSNGVSTHKRDVEYCDEKTKTFGEVVAHVCKNVEGEHILWATCTSPLVGPALYSQAYHEYLECLRNGYDSLMSVEVFKRYLWDDQGPINYQLGKAHVPSQELPPLYFITDGILIAPRKKMIEWNYFHGPNPKKFPISKRESVDIDDGLDLAVARAWLDMDPTVTQIEPYMMEHS